MTFDAEGVRAEDIRSLCEDVLNRKCAYDATDKVMAAALLPALDRITELEAALAEVHLLASTVNTRHEASWLRTIARIYALSSPLAAAEGARLAAERGLAGEYHECPLCDAGPITAGHVCPEAPR